MMIISHVMVDDLCCWCWNAFHFNLPSFWVSVLKTSKLGAVVVLLVVAAAGTPGPTGDPWGMTVSPPIAEPGYKSRSSWASLSSCACCLLSATCAAITRCLSAIRVHFAHTQSLQRQKRLWPFSAETTPWFLHLAHFGVRGYPLSSVGLQARRKRGGGRMRDGGTCKPPRVLAVCPARSSGLILLSISWGDANKVFWLYSAAIQVKSFKLLALSEWLAALYCRWHPTPARLKCLLSRWFDMKYNTLVTPLSAPASYCKTLSWLFASQMNSGLIWCNWAYSSFRNQRPAKTNPLI